MVKSKKWFKRLARAGYFSRGLVYSIIGLFAILAALGAGENKNTKDALETLLQQPFGTTIVALLIIGLVGYAIWRLVQSLLDTDDHGYSPKGLAVRTGLLSSAATYAILAIYAVSLIGLTPSGSGGGSLAKTLAGFVGTIWVSIGLAVIFAGVAAAHIWKAVRSRYADHFEASDTAMKFIHPISIIGLIARGLVFVILSVMLLLRAANAGSSTDQHPGIKEALQYLQQLPYGQFLLFVLGIGVLLFAAYSFAEAKWRRINIEDA